MAAPSQPPHMTLAQLAPDVNLLDTEAAIGITGITDDSRLVRPGDLFLAYPGLTTDGRNYIDQAVALGATAIFAEAVGLEARQCQIPVVAVTGLAGRASEFAGCFYGHPSRHMKLVGVTGTNGKTTCTQLLAQLYALLNERPGVIGTLGYGLLSDGRGDLCDTGMTTPGAVTVQKVLAQLRAEGANRVCAEVSSHSLDQGRVAGLIFNAAVFTNLSRDHLDYHGDLENYQVAKASLFEMPGLALAVVNGDDPASEDMLARLPEGVTSYRYALKDTVADVVASDVELTARGIRAQVTTPWGRGEVRSALLGDFNLSNLLAVVTTVCAQGFEFSRVLACVPHLRPVAGRMEVVDIEARPAVVVDYAHTPDALEKALRTLRSHCRGQLWCVFGCGGDRDRGKRPLMGKLAAQLADRVVVTSDNPRTENPDDIVVDILAGMPDAMSVTVAPDRAAAIREAITLAGPNDCVLIAGKGHEDYQEIGDTRLPFSDVAVARNLLQQRHMHDMPPGLGGSR